MRHTDVPCSVFRAPYRWGRKSALCVLVCLSLAACGRPKNATVLHFIGIGTGTLASDINGIHYTDTFQPQSRELVAVVSFDAIVEGSTVQATWFSPDDRTMPLGRTQIVTGSGAKVARFSFASKVPWKPAPYLLRIDAFAPGGPTSLRTATGALAFFIGMKPSDIDAYKKEFAEWQRAESLR